MALLLRATSFLYAVVCSSAARADRNDGTVQVDPEHFAKTAAHAQQIKAAVDRVQEKTKVAKEAAVAVKNQFGEYQGTIADLKGQLDNVDRATHKFEGELLEHLASEETSRLQPFEEYSLQFGHENLTDEAAGASTAPDSDASLLESGNLRPKDGRPQRGWQASSMLQLIGETARNDTGGPGRFAKSAEQSQQIKVAVGKVKEKVELTKQAAARVQQGFGDYRGKVADLKSQLREVDKQQHVYNGQLLSHFEGQEESRMSAFDEIKPGMLGSSPEVLNKSSNESALLQSGQPDLRTSRPLAPPQRHI